MSPRLVRTALGIVGMVAFVLVAEATIADDISQETARRLNREGVILALDDILERVRQRYPAARLLEAELETDDGRYVYEMEILTREGLVRELDIDATDATILEDEEED
jgi:uncharacterized membrane protein YkoI